MNYLLLTGTITPNKNIIYTKHINRRERLEEYTKSIEHWLKISDFDKIIFCENSANSEFKIQNSKIIYMTYKEDENLTNLYGKGFGEYNILNYIINNYDFNSNDVLHKVTGRYIVKNYVKNPRANVLYLRFRKNLSYSDSRYFVASIDFFRNYLIGGGQYVDEPNGVYFEHLLRDAGLKYILDGKSYIPLFTPVIDGVSGTSNTKYNSSLVRGLLSKIEANIGKIIYER
jgi:hypothetical protein